MADSESEGWVRRKRLMLAWFSAAQTNPRKASVTTVAPKNNCRGCTYLQGRTSWSHQPLTCNQPHKCFPIQFSCTPPKSPQGAGKEQKHGLPRGPLGPGWETLKYIVSKGTGRLSKLWQWKHRFQVNWMSFYPKIYHKNKSFAKQVFNAIKHTWKKKCKYRLIWAI